jgi:hypothetical protein
MDMSLSAGMSPIGVVLVYMRLKLVPIGGRGLAVQRIGPLEPVGWRCICIRGMVGALVVERFRSA